MNFDWDLDWIASNKELMALIVGFAGTLITIRRQTKVLQTQVALEFFKRYAEITSKMPDSLRLAKYRPEDAAVSDEEWARITRSMIDYGNLCSEEYALKQHGRIPNDIWALWKSGIEENFEAPLWRSAWLKVTREYDSFPEFINFMNERINKAVKVQERRSQGTNQ